VQSLLCLDRLEGRLKLTGNEVGCHILKLMLEHIQPAKEKEGIVSSWPISDAGP
jgi:hypothetical protein